MTATEPDARDPRIYFAAERTLLAWIRTGMALMGLGFVVARFGLFLRQIAALQGLPLPPGGSSRWFGAGLIVSGVVVTAGAMVFHIKTVRRLERGEPYVGHPAWLAVTTAALLAAGGIVLTWFLLASS